ncbi:YciI family protein [Bradyrhizobium pachyrhizi]|uniref:YciI family protein n=1 Tax=Bradyrhizobium pachyrhizi TaxID=280333 RepID=UPI000A7678E8|nr:YciI family protein [Bradyrhizobium pachyrhizi]
MRKSPYTVAILKVLKIRLFSMRYFFCKFHPPRPDFMRTMSADEARLMKAHGQYLQSLLEAGKVVAHGPVNDPAGGFGLSLFALPDDADLQALLQADPMLIAGTGARYEQFPMLQLRWQTT